MPTTLRRDVILSAAVAAGALGLDRSLALVAPEESHQTPAAPMPSAHKPMAPNPRPDFLRYKIGDAEITALYDGIWEKVHGRRSAGRSAIPNSIPAIRIRRSGPGRLSPPASLIRYPRNSIPTPMAWVPGTMPSSASSDSGSCSCTMDAPGISCKRSRRTSRHRSLWRRIFRARSIWGERASRPTTDTWRRQPIR
jgi:hypothetical protein